MTIKRGRTLLCTRMALAAMFLATGLLAQNDRPSTESISRESKAEADAVMKLVNGAMSEPTLQTRNARYTLRAGDVVEINFMLAPAFNQVQSVQPDGYIALQNLGDLYVSGKTVPELVEALKQKYTTIMQDPAITVVLKEFEHPYFIASGQVAKPGKYELRGVTTVTQAVAIAGGFGDAPKSSHVLLFRRGADGHVNIKELNIKNMLSHTNLEEDVQLQPGDLLFVPKSVTASLFKALFPHASTGLYFPLRNQ